VLLPLLVPPPPPMLMLMLMLPQLPMPPQRLPPV